MTGDRRLTVTTFSYTLAALTIVAFTLLAAILFITIFGIFYMVQALSTDESSKDSDSQLESADDPKPDLSIIPRDPRSNPQLSSVDDFSDRSSNIEETDKEEGGSILATEEEEGTDVGEEEKTADVKQQEKKEQQASVLEAVTQEYEELTGDNKNAPVILITNNIANNNPLHLVNHTFIPIEMSIPQGTKVTWLNTDPKTAYGLIIQESRNPDDLVFFDSLVTFLNTTEFTFNEPGTYYVYSTSSYPFMRGTINVAQTD